MLARELPLVIVACCTRYVVSELHATPRCRLCQQIPAYVSKTTWWLELPDVQAA